MYMYIQHVNYHWLADLPMASDTQQQVPIDVSLTHSQTITVYPLHLHTRSWSAHLMLWKWFQWHSLMEPGRQSMDPSFEGRISWVAKSWFLARTGKCLSWRPSGLMGRYDTRDYQYSFGWRKWKRYDWRQEYFCAATNPRVSRWLTQRYDRLNKPVVQRYRLSHRGKVEACTHTIVGRKAYWRELTDEIKFAIQSYLALPRNSLSKTPIGSSS